MMPLWVGSRCWTMTKAMPLPAGTCFRNSSRASSPPAEAPMPTMGNAFCVRGRSGFRRQGRRRSFLAHLRAGWFFHDRHPFTAEGGDMRGALFKVGIFSTPARSMAIRFPRDSCEEAHPGLRFHTTYFFGPK